MRYLTGEYFHKLDAKNRIRIPAKLKKELGDAYYFAKGTNRCLFVYAEAEVDRLIESMLAVKIGDKERQMAVQMFTKAMVPAEEDNQGRIVLPPQLKKYAGIEDDIVFCGSGNRIDVWSKANYDAYFAGADDNFDDLIRALDI